MWQLWTSSTTQHQLFWKSRSLNHSIAICFDVLYFVCMVQPSQLSYLGSLVGKSICLEHSIMFWIPPENYVAPSLESLTCEYLWLAIDVQSLLPQSSSSEQEDFNFSPSIVQKTADGDNITVKYTFNGSYINDPTMVNVSISAAFSSANVSSYIMDGNALSSSCLCRWIRNSCSVPFPAPLVSIWMRRSTLACVRSTTGL